MAGKIIADTIEASGSQISLNVGNVTILTASSTGLTLTPTSNVNINIASGSAAFTTANITTANIASISGAVVATQANQETATSTTTLVTPARQQFHPSAAKAWVKANSSGTALVSYNIASITDSSAGAGIVTIDTDFSSANYVVSASFETVGGMITGCIRTITAGTFSWYCSLNGADSAADVGSYQFSCFGDQ